MIQEVRRNVSEFSRIKVMLKKTSGWFRFIGTTRFVKKLSKLLYNVSIEPSEYICIQAQVWCTGFVSVLIFPISPIL